ncbi:AlpA family transcriptional regulator [Stenotrophomonas sp. C3(2023)]|uniref:helix-turn-helix transcriptional regulator n=1 Tax=Stenotrophomonas sp. C3(2023) TaxID=3080277 RepID=UPI00293C847E|nr:AlpA family transcriptional regulator [Stenotrophomonas sp. C3(2023)]MDV3469060.1 AlpA family transcriptional regulator [Stenotrophomonas sp. C3(2023)]
MSERMAATTPPVVFIRLPEVIRRTGMGKTTVYKRVRDGAFPAPVQLGEGMVAWIEAEVEAWQANIIAEREELSLPKAA